MLPLRVGHRTELRRVEAAEHEHRCLIEMFGEPVDAAHHGGVVGAMLDVGVGIDLGGERLRLAPGGEVEVAHRGLQRRVAHGDEDPRLAVARARCAHRGGEDLAQDRIRDRFRTEAAHRPLGMDRREEIAAADVGSGRLEAAAHAREGVGMERRGVAAVQRRRGRRLGRSGLLA